MPEIALKYGCNPNQTPARVVMSGDGPLRVVCGAPSYINVLDGLRGWQLVRDLKHATGKAAAASFKHVSPAGAAVSAVLDDAFFAAHAYDADSASLSPAATAYARARSSDRSASFGDFVAVSERVDLSLAMLLKAEVSDGIIAPGYDDDALVVLSGKKGGKYVVLAMDADYEPPAVESRTDFGVTLEQRRDGRLADASTFANVVTQAKQLPSDVVETLVVATLTIKHTQSNSIGVALDGHAIGLGAGQQSRIACTRLACDKADRWRLKSHPRAAGLRFVDGLPKAERVNAVESFVRWHELNDDERAAVRRAVTSTIEPLTVEERADWLAGRAGTSGGGLVLSSDAFIPFRDNLDRAAGSGVAFVAQAGGSARDADVVAAADQHGMVMCMTGQRWFLH